MEFAVLKAVHVACVAISYLLFFARGIWMINGSPLLQQRRIVDHPDAARKKQQIADCHAGYVHRF